MGMGAVTTVIDDMSKDEQIEMLKRELITLRALAKNYYNHTFACPDIRFESACQDALAKAAEAARILSHGLVRSPEFLESLKMPTPQDDTP